MPYSISSPVSLPEADHNQSYLITIAIGFSIVITTLAIFLRLVARTLHNVYLGADDYAIVLGALFTIANAVVYIFGEIYFSIMSASILIYINSANQSGNGRHMSTLTVDELDSLFKCFYASYQLYGLAVTFIKLSVLLFYRRIFPLAHLRKRINIVGGFVIAWLLANNLLAALQCMPVQKAWLLELPGQCINPLAFVLAIQVPNVVLDIIVLALPMHVVYKLHLRRSKKIGLVGIFLLGGGSVFIAIVRLGVLVVSLDQEDTSYSTPKTSLTVIEPAVELLSACLPTMASFLHLRTHLSELRAKVRLFFSSQRSLLSPEADSRPQFPDIKHPGREVYANAKHEPRPTITATGRHSVEQTDQIPLHAIMVRNDMAWEEERNESNASSNEMIQAGEQMV